jgi:DNA-directed RNA polymerase-3 subunit RPC5
MEVEDDVMEQEATGRGQPVGENSSAVPEEEDEVVKIVDVYLSQEAAPHLYLLQYPLRPTWRPYDRENITEVRYKPKARKLEFEFALSESEIQNYYDDQVEDHSKTVTLTSTPVLPQTNYAIAVLRSGPERTLPATYHY